METRTNDLKKDRELGVNREITRRDFLNGVAIGVGRTLIGGGIGTETLIAAAALDEFAPEKARDYYPPGRMGMRGNHDGTFTFAHRLRDGEAADSFGDAANTGESYDLIVVGGGISGLAAAYFFRKRAGKNARILILDNHDDFGGHAKRNEFQAGGSTLLSFGGRSPSRAPLNTAVSPRTCSSNWASIRSASTSLTTRNCIPTWVPRLSLIKRRLARTDWLRG